MTTRDPHVGPDRTRSLGTDRLLRDLSAVRDLASDGEGRNATYDCIKAFTQQIVLYVVAAAVIAALFTQIAWAAWIGLVFSIIMILVSVLYYNPVIMLERKPGLIHWVEDLLFTGLLFVAATLLLYEVQGRTLQP